MAQQQQKDPRASRFTEGPFDESDSDVFWRWVRFWACACPWTFSCRGTVSRAWEVYGVSRSILSGFPTVCSVSLASVGLLDLSGCKVWGEIRVGGLWRLGVCLATLPYSSLLFYFVYGAASNVHRADTFESV